MPLTAEQYMELVFKQKEDQNFEMVDGHRRARRIPYIGMVEIQPIVESEPQPKIAVRLRDISARGMAILDRWTAAKGSQFVASMTREGRGPMRILCTVSYSTRLPGNLFRTGAEITAVLPDPSAPPRKPQPVRSPVAASVDAGEADRIRRSILG